jgi:hypothetical protein
VLSTIVTRAPTHEPFKGHNSGVDVTVNLNDTSTAAVAATASTENVAIARVGSNAELAQVAFHRIDSQPVILPISKGDFLGTKPATTTIPVAAE